MEYGGKKEYLFKILVIGDMGTGKTSIIKRYAKNMFSENYKATIGVDFAIKLLDWDSRTFIRLQLWDIAGQERYGNMTRVYYKDSNAAFIVFDVTRNESFEAVLKWKRDLDSKVMVRGEKIPTVLLANKVDLTQDIEGNKDKLDDFCKENGFIKWFGVSARTGLLIEESVEFLVESILEKRNWNEEEAPNNPSTRLHESANRRNQADKRNCFC